MPSRIAFAVTSGVDSRTILRYEWCGKTAWKRRYALLSAGLPVNHSVSREHLYRIKKYSHVVDFLTEKNGNASYDPRIEDQIHAAAASTGAAAECQTADERDAYFADAGKIY